MVGSAGRAKGGRGGVKGLVWLAHEAAHGELRLEIVPLQPSHQLRHLRVVLRRQQHRLVLVAAEVTRCCRCRRRRAVLRLLGLELEEQPARERREGERHADTRGDGVIDAAEHDGEAAAPRERLAQARVEHDRLRLAHLELLDLEDRAVDQRELVQPRRRAEAALALLELALADELVRRRRDPVELRAHQLALRRRRAVAREKLRDHERAVLGRCRRRRERVQLRVGWEPPEGVVGDPKRRERAVDGGGRAVTRREGVAHPLARRRAAEQQPLADLGGVGRQSARLDASTGAVELSVERLCDGGHVWPPLSAATVGWTSRSKTKRRPNSTSFAALSELAPFSRDVRQNITPAAFTYRHLVIYTSTSITTLHIHMYISANYMAQGDQPLR